MPTISLRLTDKEHAALKEWAHGSHRSMQREAVYRIFAGLSEREAPNDVERAASSGAMRESAHQKPVTGVPPRSESDRHFKPDFK